LAALWLAWSISRFALPPADPAFPTDATFFLASDGGDEALRSRPDLRVGAVVVSRPASVADRPHYAICSQPGVTCVTPEPEETRGECAAFAAAAKTHGWRSVTVVSQTSHVARIRMLMPRCFAGQVRVEAIDTHPTATQWLRMFAYETGATIKALVLQDC